MIESDVLIRCENVGKKFCRDLKKSLWYGVKDSFSDLVSRNSTQNNRQDSPELRPGEFWANKDINFELSRGECLGLIGRNGAGKTTLLKMLNGLIKPDTGLIQMRGQIGALIALGAGFNPLLTGRENINVNASILGMSRKQIAHITDDVVEFAEISEFIDSPVRTYSSGMTVRLGFAIATCMRPDILIVDEVLAVGDADFRLKCVQRMRNVMKSGCAVLLVSHNMTDIRNLASLAIWLQNGRPKKFGKPFEVITEYLGTSHTQNAKVTWSDTKTAPGCDAVTLRSLSIDPRGDATGITISSGALVKFDFECRGVQLRLDFTLEVRTEEQIVAFHAGGRISPDGDSKRGFYTIEVEFPANLLNSGKYQLSLLIGESQSTILANAVNALTFEVGNEARGSNHSQRPGVVAPDLNWQYTFKTLTEQTRQ